MNILDIVFLVIVCLLMLRGLYRGILIEVAGIVGVILGFWLAKMYSPVLAPYIAKAISTAGWAPVLAFLLIFLLTIFLFTLAAKAIKGILTLTFVGWVDNLFGAFLGLAKGVLVCAVALALFQAFMPNAGFLNGSLFAPWLQVVSDYLKQFVPTTMV